MYLEPSLRKIACVVTQEVVPNTNLKPEVAADQAREAYRQSTDQFEALLKTAFPQAAHEFAEKTVAQTREAYERSNKALALRWRLWRNLLTRRARALQR